MAWQFAPGEILTATNLNAVTMPNNAVCILTDGSQTINDGATTAISFGDTDILDPRGWHNPASLPERTIPDIAGYYLIVGGARLASLASTVQRRATYVTLNGANITPEVDTPPATGINSQHGQTVTGYALLNGTTDYVGLSVYQDDTGSGARAMSSLLIVKLLYPS